MRLPKKVKICGVDWDIKTDPKMAGGEFHGGKYAITVGTLFKKDMLEIFLHEVLEAIITERCHRYKIYDDETNEKIMFVFNHAEFVNIIKDLSCAIRGILKQ